MDIDRPACDFDRVIDRRFDAKDLFREGGHDVGRNPWRAEARGDVGGLQVLGQGLFERRRHCADNARRAQPRRPGGRELVADLARQIGVGRHPDVALLRDGSPRDRGRCARRVRRSPSRATGREARRSRSRSTRPVSCNVTASASSAVSITGVVSGCSDALAKDRSMLRRSAFEIVILDRGDQPDVGVVEERLKVRAAEGLARLALGRHGLADRRQVDRAEVANEEGVGRAQPDLRRSPGFIIRLGAQNLANGVANGDQAADDAGVLRGDPLRPLCRRARRRACGPPPMIWTSAPSGRDSCPP